MIFSTIQNFDFYQAFIETVRSGALTLVAVIIAISFFFYQQHKEKVKEKDRLRRICNLLLLDMKLLDEWLIQGHGAGQEVQTGFGTYTEAVVSPDHYYSVLYSGLITYLQKDTQHDVSHFYHFIVLYNKRMFDINEMVNRRMNSGTQNEDDILNDLKQSHAWKNNEEQLAIYKNKMKDLLPKVRHALESEIKKLQ